MGDVPFLDQRGSIMLTEEIKQRFETDGYAILEKYYSGEEVDFLNRQIDAFLKNRKNYTFGNYLRKSNYER